MIRSQKKIGGREEEGDSRKSSMSEGMELSASIHEARYTGMYTQGVISVQRYRCLQVLERLLLFISMCHDVKNVGSTGLEAGKSMIHLGNCTNAELHEA